MALRILMSPTLGAGSLPITQPVILSTGSPEKHQPKCFCEVEVRKAGVWGAAPGSTTQNLASNGLKLKAWRKPLLKNLFP